MASLKVLKREFRQCCPWVTDSRSLEHRQCIFWCIWLTALHWSLLQFPKGHSFNFDECLGVDAVSLPPPFLVIRKVLQPKYSLRIGRRGATERFTRSCFVLKECSNSRVSSRVPDRFPSLPLSRYGWCLPPLIFTSNKCAILRECRVFPLPSPPPSLPPSLPVPLSIFQVTFTVGYWGAGREFKRKVNRACVQATIFI